jgi:hypothetical protein
VKFFSTHLPKGARLYGPARGQLGDQSIPPEEGINLSD